MFPSLLPLLLLLLLLCSHGGAAEQKTSANELAILLDLKAALGAATTTALDSWRPGGNPCSFPGVLCDARGSIYDIDLSHRPLSGTIPFKSLCRLPSLVRLWLGATGVSGEVSAEIGACRGLRFLDLAYNSLSGKIPDLNPLQNLRVLNFSGNGFTGSFPWASLARMPELYSLSLGDNPFDQTAGFPAEILGRTKLQWLYLSNCSIHGVIPPGIGNLTGLVNLELSDNHLYGQIPPEISRLSSLWQLELYNNNLTGELPRGFGGLANLAFFDASMNNLVGNLSEIRFLTKLVSLQLFENDFSGEVPAALGSWAEFNFIDVSTNLLTGPIPPDMCKRGTMKKLLMLENQFTGEIPATYANCTSLERFRVSDNSLSGEVPAGIWSLPNVNIIDLKSNQFSGSIGAGIGKAKSLSQLFISHNQFSGDLPAEIAGASSLVSLDASYNQISGEVPASVGELKALVSLYLQGNRFRGEIPNSLGSCSSLTQVNLAENSLSGRIPASLGRLSNLNSLILSTNDLSGDIPGSLGSLKLSFLNVSGNLLTGAVPPALAIEAFSDGFSSPSARDRLRMVIACLLVAAAVAFAIFGYFVYVKRRRETSRGLFSRESWDMKSFRVISFEEQEIINAIRQENLIGKGGSGNVYRVDLVGGKTVAVKHIWNYHPDANKGDASAAILGGRRRRSKEGLSSREFEAEVTTLSAVRHVNVVKLFCSITGEDSSLLVYEFLPNGSLWDRLHTCEGGKLGGLDWDARYDVALGAARGLEYLHHGLQRPIVHRDVKSSNILLDESFKPRIADFGLAKILHGQAAAAATPSPTSDASSTHVVAGTHGYIAPEYAYTLKVNEKSDVYSFGVVLLELVTGRRPIEPEYGDNKDIVYWVYSNMTCIEGVMELVLDKRIPEWAREEAVKVLRVGVLCTMRLPSLRPSMRAVVQMLEEAGRDRLAPAAAADDGGVKDHKEGSEPDPKQEKQRASPQ